VNPAATIPATDGVRLLSHRPSVLYKVEHLATVRAEHDIAQEGITLAGPDWQARLKALLAELSIMERECLFGVRLGDEQALPLAANVLLERERTDWFPEFLGHGRMFPHFQPIVDIATHRTIGREALMRGRLGKIELRGGELVGAAEAHDALYSFDVRARTAALETGLPLLPGEEILFLNVDPRATLEPQSSVRTVWPTVERLGFAPGRLCLEFIDAEQCPDRGLLRAMAEAHRERGALISLDDLSGGSDALACLELLRPDYVKLDMPLTKRIDHSAGRRRLVHALVDCAHELGARVVAEGIERVEEYHAMAELGVDCAQGFYFGMPTEKPMVVDQRLFTHRV
jgi:EAL domain-containing protein (putative c-di-GMP-specific phosphodiesterase class I)